MVAAEGGGVLDQLGQQVDDVDGDVPSDVDVDHRQEPTRWYSSTSAAAAWPHRSRSSARPNAGPPRCPRGRPGPRRCAHAGRQMVEAEQVLEGLEGSRCAPGRPAAGWRSIKPWERRAKLMNMSRIDLRRAACWVATWMATRCTELKADDTWPISSLDVTGTGSGTTSRSLGSLACCSCSTTPGSRSSATSLAVRSATAAGGPWSGHQEREADGEPQHQGQDECVEGLAVGHSPSVLASSRTGRRPPAARPGEAAIWRLRREIAGQGRGRSALGDRRSTPYRAAGSPARPGCPGAPASEARAQARVGVDWLRHACCAPTISSNAWSSP